MPAKAGDTRIATGSCVRACVRICIFVLATCPVVVCKDEMEAPSLEERLDTQYKLFSTSSSRTSCLWTTHLLELLRIPVVRLVLSSSSESEETRQHQSVTGPEPDQQGRLLLAVQEASHSGSRYHQSSSSDSG